MVSCQPAGGFSRVGRVGCILLVSIVLPIAAREGLAQTSTAPSARASAAPGALATATVPELQRELAEQRALLSRQGQALVALEQEMALLRARLDQGAAIASVVTSPAIAAAPSMPAAPAAAPSFQAATAPGAPPPQAADGSVARLPELPEKVVTAGDFPGSIRMPGTDTAFKFGGQARFTMVHTLAPLGVDDRFISSSIPVTTIPPGESSRTTYNATPSRLNFDVRSPTRFGNLRTFVESDFAGDGATSRLRHAYLQTDRWLFGQTWSTFSNPEADPLDIDFEGLNAISRLRQAQLRYTCTVATRFEVAAALENPAPDLSGAQGVNLTPDLVGRVRWEPARFPGLLNTGVSHVQFAVMGRSLRGSPTSQPDMTLTTGGFGFSLSGVLTPRWGARDHVKFAVNDGWGIGRYVTDLAAEGGQDAIYDPIHNALRALPVTSSYIGYERAMKRNLLGTFTYGLVTVHNLDVQGTDALHRTRRGSASITWRLLPQGDLILEYLAGERINKDGEHGVSSQIQGGWKLVF